MKVLVIDTYGVGVDLCMRAQWAGHQVKHYLAPTPTQKFPNIGRGLTTRVTDWRQHMRWADLIILTASAKYTAEMEWYFKHGFPIFGANEDSANLELDRCVGMELLRNHGIEVLDYRRFEGYKEAKAYVRHTCGEFVCKPIGDADRALSYVSSGPDDMIDMMDYYEKKATKTQPFILQEKMHGIEMAVAGWFGKDGWVGPWEENFEHKKLYAGELGPNTGEMGTAMKYVDESPLADYFLKPIEQALNALNFRGNVDVSCIIDDKGQPWPLEFTMRMGWPAFYLNSHLHKGDPVEWMADALEGRDTLHTSYEHCIGVCVVGPGFPGNHEAHYRHEGIPLFGINTGNVKNMHFVEVQSGTADCYEGGKWETKHIFRTAGSWPLVVVDTSSSVSMAAQRAYDGIEGLKIPNSHAHRVDIGKRLKKQIPELQKKGWAKSWEYGRDDG